MAGEKGSPIISITPPDHLTCFKLDDEEVRETKFVTISNQFVQNEPLEVTDKAKWFCEASSKEDLGVVGDDNDKDDDDD